MAPMILRGSLLAMLAAGVNALAAQEASKADCAPSAGSVVPGEAGEAARRWVADHAEPIVVEDAGGQSAEPAFLDEIVGGARVVALGEPMHGAHEALVLRNRVFFYLAERLGFTALAAETDFVDGAAIDDYVMGRGELTDELIAGVFSFSAPEAAAENRQLLEWMRAFNSRPGGARKVRFYGLEMMGRSLRHADPIVGRPLETALRYLASVDPKHEAVYRRRVQPMLAAWARRPPTREEGGSSPSEGLPPGLGDAYTAAIADLIALFERRAVQWIARTSVSAYERAYRSVLNARALDADFRANGWWPGCSVPDEDCDPDQRDATSAQNLAWALAREGPQGRVMLFAHNAHVRRGVVLETGRPGFTSLGQHLGARLGEDLVVIGTFFGATRGFSEQYPAWYDGLSGVLGGTTLPAYALNLRALPAAGPVPTWWKREIAGSRCRSLNPATAFDALVFVSVGTPWLVTGRSQNECG